MILVRTTLAAFLASTGGFAVVARAQDTSVDTAPIRAVVEKYLKSVNAADLTLASEIWSDRSDIVVVTPFGRFEGWTNVREKLYIDFLQKSLLERNLQASNLAIRVADDTAWAVFDWTFNGKLANGQPITSKGWESHVYRRMAGSWKIVQLHYSAQSVPPPAGDPAAGRILFERGGCLDCHAPPHRDRQLGPDLSRIGLLRSAESLRRLLIASKVHDSARSDAEIENLVAYLRTLRSIPPSTPGERTRSIPGASENVEFFNRPERNAEEQSDALVRALEIREGTRIADLGAGTGYFTWRLAQSVGPTGKVIAVDIQPRMLELSAKTVKEHGLTNVDYVVGRERDPKLPAASLDMVFIAHAYHEFSDPEAIMESVRRSLKPGGRLVVVEYAKEHKLAPASSLHKMTFDEIRDEIESMGFDLDRILDFLPVQHGLIFTVR